MIPKDTFNDREIQVIKASLKFTLKTLQDEADNPKSPLNEYDVMDVKHTLMHILTALAKLTGTPITSYQNPIQEQGRLPLTDLPQAS